MVKHLPAMWESWVRSLGQEDPLEREVATTPVLLPGKSHGQRSQVGYRRVRLNGVASLPHNPSCLPFPWEVFVMKM